MARHGPGGSASPYAADVPKGYVYISSETQGDQIVSTYHVYEPRPPSVGRHGPSGGISPFAAGPQTVISYGPISRSPRGIEDVYGTTQQYGIFSWEKEQPSIIRTQPTQPSTRDIIGTSGTPRIIPTEPTFPKWSKSVYETWFPTTTPTESVEFALSELAFRRLWDPSYKARYEAQQRKYATLDIGKIQQQRAEQAEVAAIGITLTAPLTLYAAEKYGPKLTGFISEKTGIQELNRRFDVWLLKRTEEGKMIEALSWEPETRELAIGFERAFPTDITKTMSYKTYPGFETWATWQEPSKFAGYPTLRPLSAAPMQEFLLATERSIFGPSAVFEGMTPAKQLQAFETFWTTKEAHPYAGYPVIYREITGIRLVKEPSAFEQILQGIEKGRFYRMGGLSATQVPMFAKPEQIFKPWVPSVSRGKSSFSGYPASFEAWTKRATTSYQWPYVAPVPNLSNLLGPKTPQRMKSPQVPRLEIPDMNWEREKEKFRNLIEVTPKTSMKEASIQETFIISKQRQAQLQVLAFPPIFPTPQKQKSLFPSFRSSSKIPSSPFLPFFPTKWPLGGGESGGGGGGSLFGKWFKKTQKIKTPQQMLETFFGSRQRRKRK